MNPYEVLVKPLLSEKSNKARESSKYSFRVVKSATKAEVRKAVETLYQVKVESVQTLVVRGKVKRRGNHVVKLSNTKKAIVTLAKDAKLPVFDAL